MNIKGQMRSSDYHLVIQTQALRFKLFNATGTPVFSGVLSLHPESPAMAPVPSQGKCALASGRTKQYLHVSHLGSYKEPTYVDVMLTRPGKTLSDKMAASWQDARGVIYQISDLEFDALMKFAKNLDGNISGADMDKVITSVNAPVVYVSYA